MTDRITSRDVLLSALADYPDENPWLGDVDRRADDDVEFCDEGEWMDDDD